MFVGQSQHQLDEKGRIRIPSIFKEGLGKNPFITCGGGGCLVVYPRQQAEDMLLKRFADNDFANPDTARAIRLMMSSAVFAEEDKQGRILLPRHLTEHSGIVKNIVTIGALDHVEIWNQESWDAYRQGVDFDQAMNLIRKDRT